jgi:WD40 repeat protein
LSSDTQGNIDLWSLASKKHLARVWVGANDVRLSPVAFSPDSRLFAAPTNILESGGQVCPKLVLCDTTTLKKLRSFDTDPNFPYSAAFAPDGNTLLTDNGAGALLLDDLKTGRQRAVNCDPPVRTLAISPDGKTLATGDRQGNVVLRDIQTMRELARFQLSDRPPPYWLILIGAFFLWAFLWFNFRKRFPPKQDEGRTIP